MTRRQLERARYRLRLTDRLARRDEDAAWEHRVAEAALAKGLHIARQVLGLQLALEARRADGNLEADALLASMVHPSLRAVR